MTGNLTRLVLTNLPVLLFAAAFVVAVSPPPRAQQVSKSRRIG